jgi:hypothetical protein
MDAAAGERLAARLAGLGAPALALPSALRGSGGGGGGEPPTTSAITSHLHELLFRAPGIFLERHGAHLTAAERAAFAPLAAAGDAEVSHYLDRLSAAPPSPAAARNRRLAAMQRLEAEGHFDDAQVRRRHPLLFHELVGRFQSDAQRADAEAADAGAPGGIGGRLSSAILRGFDAAEGAAALRSQQAAEEGQRSEAESEESDEERAEAGPSVMEDDAGEERRRARLRTELRALYMCGADGVSAAYYAAIDADASLDDDLLSQVGRDEEDAYFDAG